VRRRSGGDGSAPFGLTMLEPLDSLSGGVAARRPLICEPVAGRRIRRPSRVLEARSARARAARDCTKPAAKIGFNLHERVNADVCETEGLALPRSSAGSTSPPHPTPRTQRPSLSRAPAALPCGGVGGRGGLEHMSFERRIPVYLPYRRLVCDNNFIVSPIHPPSALTAPPLPPPPPPRPP
jgi:hypothetical protein